ncbi:MULTISPECIES: hypothetical protein [Elizabethkingia]|jgi:hypothetical protein|uniref:hypothetical protein n=1 Tax=Elizabethkingia TaxID=308865 RepID=UPI0010C20FA1|nr:MULTISPECIES: hypothetical protein [Elizabethkingia]QCO45769.1 hypothetical protein FCS00_05065 [Elizabethkingia sp. 2-6]WQM37678.1 hypothetical protein U2S95_15065 [Elizabethkingia miricola]DAN07591.1 MAG TPA: hypothetical protein [Crassvirales sp.]
MSTTISKNLQNYLKKIESQSSKVPVDGYFHIDHVIDAFSKGEQYGVEKALEEFKENFVRATTQMFLYGNDFIKNLTEKGYSVSDYYINPFDFKFMVTTPVENTFNEDFIYAFYETSCFYEEKFKSEFNISMRILFIQDVELNESELKINGFINL